MHAKITMILAAGTLAAAAAALPWPHDDVLKMSRESLDNAASSVVELVAAFGVTNALVDYGIVGSYACGCARVSEASPSDLDIAIYLTSNAVPLNAWFIRAGDHAVYAEWERKFQTAIGFPHAINITFMDQKFLYLGDPNYIFYSLKSRTMRGRVDGRPRYDKLLFIGDAYVTVDRELFGREMSNAIARVHGPVRAHSLSNGVVYFASTITSNILFSLPEKRIGTPRR